MENEPRNSQLASERYQHYRQLLDRISNKPDPRHVPMVLHHDSFAPFSTRPDDYSVGYLLVRPLVGVRASAMQKLVQAWVIMQGPEHFKCFEPILEILREQVRQCLHVGVDCYWPLRTSCHYDGQRYHIPVGRTVLHGVIACTCSDQPAACTVNGHTSHNAKMACRCDRDHAR